MNKLQLTKFLRNTGKKTPSNSILQSAGINDADYKINQTIDGVKYKCPAFQTWIDIIKRVYSAKYHKRKPTYKEVVLCEKWHSFMAFREWWLEHYKEGCQIDKDILGNGKEYSPEKCLFVPEWVNLMACLRNRKSAGASYKKSHKKFVAQFNKKTLGLFDTEQEAHEAWKEARIKALEEKKDALGKVDHRIFHNLQRMILESK